MRFYIFKSETPKNLRAFAGDVVGTKLPDNDAPWTIGVLSPTRFPKWFDLYPFAHIGPARGKTNKSPARALTAMGAS